MLEEPVDSEPAAQPDPARNIRIDVPSEQVGERLDRLVAGHVRALSRSRVRQLITAGEVRVDGVVVTKPARTLGVGAVVEFELVARRPQFRLEPEAIPLSVLYEDEHLAVIDKAAGMVMHPAPGNRTGTLVHAMLHRYGERLAASTEAARPGIVHRLDKGTTGALVVALKDTIHEALQRQFAARTVAKQYLALVYGRPARPGGLVDVPLGRDRVDRKKISANTRQPREASTEWEREEDFVGVTMVRLRPRTGRTHQIRAHMTHIGHPLVGDAAYCGRRFRSINDPMVRQYIASFARPALHAASLAFDHPVSGERLCFEAPIAADLSSLIEVLRRHRDGGAEPGATD